ncbi:MAG: thioesterase family protein [Rhodospirillales bacterium]|nr:thioesterase family protein [Rhodospirillales bacterium]
MRQPAQIPAPFDRHRETVRPEWIDYNDHMNVAYYVLVFDHGTDAFFELLGIDEGYRRRTGHSTFAMEQHVAYVGEVKVGDELRVTTQLIGHDEKRLHFFHRMYHARDGYLAATSELMGLHVDLAGRRAAPFPPEVLATIRRVAAAHAGLPRPEELGQTIGLRRRPNPARP